jgi:excisionase family DNA binding protein
VFEMLCNTPDTLTLKDLQEVLHIGKNTALKLIHENVLAGHLIGGKWLVLREDVEEYIQRV